MSALTGTWPLARLALRRDRVALPLWIVVLSAIPAGTVSAYDQLYPDEASRQALNAGSGSNPSLSLLYGPAYDLTTAGGFTAWRYGAFLSLFVALVAIFTVTRHTRAEEDSGRLELLGSTVVGRYAALTAAMAVTGGASVLIGVLSSAFMIGAGLPAAGAFALGLGVGAVGLVFTSVAAVAAQLTEYSRSANGISAAVIGVAFLLRGVGDSTVDARWLSWLSPLSWPQHAKPFVDEQWWVLGLAVVAAAAIGSVAYFLVPRRDIGAGLLPTRLGSPTAPASLSSSLGLAWRLQRGPLVGWAIAMAVVGGVFGSIANGVAQLVGTSAQITEMFQRMGGAQGVVDSYLAALGGIYALIVTVYAVQAALRPRAEETGLRAEPVLATGVSRLGWQAGHLVFALLGPALLLGVAGVASGVTHGLRAGDLGTQVGHALSGTITQLPAVWVVVSVVVLAFGSLPSLTVPLSWAALGVCVLITFFGPVLGVGQAVMDVSPFSHVPKLPGAEFTATPLLWLTGIAVVITGAGLAAFRRRDIG